MKCCNHRKLQEPRFTSGIWFVEIPLVPFQDSSLLVWLKQYSVTVFVVDIVNSFSTRLCIVQKETATDCSSCTNTVWSEKHQKRLENMPERSVLAQLHLVLPCLLLFAVSGWFSECDHIGFPRENGFPVVCPELLEQVSSHNYKRSRASAWPLFCALFSLYICGPCHSFFRSRQLHDIPVETQSISSLFHQSWMGFSQLHLNDHETTNGALPCCCLQIPVRLLHDSFHLEVVMHGSQNPRDCYPMRLILLPLFPCLYQTTSQSTWISHTRASVNHNTNTLVHHYVSFPDLIVCWATIELCTWHPFNTRRKRNANCCVKTPQAYSISLVYLLACSRFLALRSSEPLLWGFSVYQLI